MELISSGAELVIFFVEEIILEKATWLKKLSNLKMHWINVNKSKCWKSNNLYPELSIFFSMIKVK